jgi:hypothetical protein
MFGCTVKVEQVAITFECREPKKATCYNNNQNHEGTGNRGKCSTRSVAGNIIGASLPRHSTSDRGYAAAKSLGFSGAPRLLIVHPHDIFQYLHDLSTLASPCQVVIPPTFMRTFPTCTSLFRPQLHCDGSSRIMNLRRRLDWPYLAVFDPKRFVRVGPCAGCRTRHLSFAEKLTPDPTAI